MANGVAGLENLRAVSRQAQPPDDFEDEAAFLAFARKQFQSGIDGDRDNREQALEDFRFFSGDQWPDEVKQRRRRNKKPMLTINRLPAFVQTFIANRRLNEVGIDVHPDVGGDKEVAKVRKELIRSIQKLSKADRTYEKAFENTVIGGIGGFQVVLDFAHDDVFEQDIRIRNIANPLAVVWDPSSTDPTGRDAQWCFVTDAMPKDEFKAMWPEATAGLPTNDTRLVGVDLKEGNLTIGDDKVDVASFWRLRREPRIMAMMANGDVEDVTEQDEAIWLPRVAQRRDGDPMIRETERTFAEMHLITATDILEGPYRLPIKRLPVFRTSGWDINIGNERRRFGLIRFLRDPQTLHNYWRTVIAERLMGAPKSKWIAPDNAVEGREKQWRDSHLDDDALLVYNSDAGTAPIRSSPPPMEDALVNEAALSAQDLRDVSSLHEASLGQESNEVSGKGILARQRVGEAASVIYNENVNDAIQEAGEVINDLIPVVYDTPRVIKVIGEADEKMRMVAINDYGDDPNAIDITAGRYETTITTGPSYATRRIEAAESMLNMVNAMPETMNVAADEIVEAQDWPRADKIAARIRATMPPGVVSAEDMTEEQRQRLQAQAQAEAEQAEQERRTRQIEDAEKEARAVEAIARARDALAREYKSYIEADLAPEKAWSEMQNSRLNALIQGISALHNVADRGDSNGTDQT